MKQTHYFTVNFTGFTTAASEEQSYLRLTAGEHAFYTDKRHFKDPSLFDRLRLGQPPHIGTCRLKDAVTGSTGLAMATFCSNLPGSR